MSHVHPVPVMSEPAPPPVPDTEAGGGSRRRRRLLIVLAVVAVVLAAALSAGPPRPGQAYDPDNVGPDGLAGLVDLLERFEIDVEVSPDPPSDMSTHLFIATDRLGEERRAAVSDWVDDGGTLIVAGPSPLHGLTLTGASVTDLFGATPRAPACEADGLADVAAVEHAAWEGLAVPEDHPELVRCFQPEGGAPWMVASRQGEGVVVVLGSAAPFVNASLARADNAVLAAALLAPQPGDRLTIVPPAAVGEGETAVTELVPAGFWRLLILAVVAAVVAVLWRARRLGPPVLERLPPVLPSAELARSVAALLQRAGDRSTAAGRLRGDARREALQALGVPAATDDRHLVDLLVARTGVDSTTASVALTGGRVESDGDLLAVARACAELRSHLRHPEPDPEHVDEAT